MMLADSPHLGHKVVLVQKSAAGVWRERLLTATRRGRWLAVGSFGTAGLET